MADGCTSSPVRGCSPSPRPRPRSPKRPIAKIAYVQVSREDFVADLAEAGVPDDAVELLAYLFTTVLDGRNAHLGDGVQRALGREPRDFYDYAWGTPPSERGIWGQGCTS